MKHVSADLDPAEFVVVPHTAALDEFKMTADDGSFVADITPKFLEKLVVHMNERESATGDLCPIVIGHTQSDLPETQQPPVVGFARNWHLGTLGATGRQCAFFDAWIYRDKVSLAKQFPRRSGEIWASRFECDPISLLGATTPTRDLGLMKLSREGSFTYYPPGETQMPAEEKKDPQADPKETGMAKGEDAKLDQILGLLTQLVEKMGASAAPPAAPGAAGPDAGAAPGGEGQMSDAELDSFLQSLFQGESKGGEEPTKQEPAAPEKKDEPAKMSRQEQELADLRSELTRMQVKDRLVKLARPDIADPDDQALIQDLVSMPPDIRERQLTRLARTPAAPGSGDVTHLNRALDSAQPNVGGKRRVPNVEEKVRLQRRAVAERKSFEQVASEEGYDLS